tara:strand:- start:9863 stop:10327 length:465 start_codon:yes stop_codon:yes gene_type:complete
MSDFPEAAIYTLLTSDTDITDIIGDNVYPVLAPQNITGPYIRFQTITQLPDRQLIAASTLQHSRIQIDGYVREGNATSSPYFIIKDLMNKIRLALDGYRGDVVIDGGSTVHIDSLSLLNSEDILTGPNDGGDIPVYHISSDYSIGSQLTVPTHP